MIFSWSSNSLPINRRNLCCLVWVLRGVVSVFILWGSERYTRGRYPLPRYDMKWWLFDVQTALKYLISGKSKQTVMNDRYSSFRFLWAAQTMFLIQYLRRGGGGGSWRIYSRQTGWAFLGPAYYTCCGGREINNSWVLSSALIKCQWHCIRFLLSNPIKKNSLWNPAVNCRHIRSYSSSSGYWCSE